MTGTPAVAFAIPGDLSTPTGGYAYDRKVLARLPAQGIAVTHLPLPGGFPNPSTADIDAVVRLANDTPGGTVLLVDGLALGAMPAPALRHVSRPIVALCHHPLGLEAGLNPNRAAELVACERAALACCKAVIATSPATARLLMREFDVPEAYLHIAEPGTEPAPRASRGGEPVRLLAIGSLIPRKGYEFLLRALATLTDLPWRLTIVGGPRDEAYAATLARLTTELRLTDRVTFAGGTDDAGVAAAYGQADIFVMPSLFEGYGMVLAEALARGLPIVVTTGGAAAETVPDDAALKVPPADADALAAALRRLLPDRPLQDRLSDAAWAGAKRLPTWEHCAAAIARVLHAVAADEVTR